MFSTKGQEIKGGGVQKSLQPGVVYAHIYDGKVKSSKNGKKMLELTLEGPELENFEGWSVNKDDQNGVKFKGQSARVTATVFTEEFNNSDITKNEILSKLLIIATEVGLRDEVDDISTAHNVNSIEEWVAHAIDILRGENAYFFLKGTEEEYNGKTIVKLSLPKYKFCSKDESRLDKFDKTNQYHYKALVKSPSLSGFEPAAVDDDFTV
jgi:hypothetical protein